MINKQKRYFVIYYLLAFSAMTNARSNDDNNSRDNWTIGDVMKYSGMAVLGGALAVFAPPVVLGAAGFTATGIAAGSLAAVTQAGIGNVVGGTLFAAAQSAGVAGIGGAASAALATAGAAIGAGITRIFDSKTEKKDD